MKIDNKVIQKVGQEDTILIFKDKEAIVLESQGP